MSKETSTVEYKQKTWDLSELLPEPREELVSARLEELGKAVSEIEAARPRLDSDLDPREYLDLVRSYEAIVERVYEIGRAHV